MVAPSEKSEKQLALHLTWPWSSITQGALVSASGGQKPPDNCGGRWEEDAQRRHTTAMLSKVFKGSHRLSQQADIHHVDVRLTTSKSGEARWQTRALGRAVPFGLLEDAKNGVEEPLSQGQGGRCRPTTPGPNKRRRYHRSVFSLTMSEFEGLVGTTEKLP
ncbi:hypothetical protein VTI74DRAFT_2985 [Chaetomium olivicolor]